MNRTAGCKILSMVILPFCSAWSQQNPLGTMPRGTTPAAPDTRPFDPKDLSGVWRGDKYGYNAKYVPAMTPEGQKKFESYKPSYGLTKGTPQAEQQTDIPIGRRRAIPPALGNDPVGGCNPLGLIRLLLYDPSPMEIVQTPDRVLQLFEWTWDRREIWADGRAQAKVDEYLPRFNGYSIGKWEGNTLVVSTVGLDDRAWMDHFGYPISDQAKLEERWHRTSYGILELTMVLTDPKIYTEPWKSEVVHFSRIPKDALSAGVGWAALAEDRCVPLDEVDIYNKQVRNPAGGVK
jgi:hypothetical protein